MKDQENKARRLFKTSGGKYMYIWGHSHLFWLYLRNLKIKGDQNTF